MRSKPAIVLLSMVMFLAGCWALDSNNDDLVFDETQEASCVVGTASFETLTDAVVVRCSVEGELVSPQQVKRCPRGQAEGTQVNSNTISVRCGPKPTTTTTTTSPTTTTTTASTTTTTTTTTPPSGTLYWHGEADNDTDLGDQTMCLDKNTETLPTARLSITSDPNAGFEYVYKSELLSSDGGNRRAEWSKTFDNCDGDNALNLWGTDSVPTTDVYIGWRSFFSGSGFIQGGSNDGNYFQWKGDSSCGGPAVGMTVNNSRLSLRTLDGADPDDPSWQGQDGVWVDTQLLSNRMFAWHDFVMRVNFSKGSDGFIELWVDGVPQIMKDGTTRFEGPTVCPNDTKVWFKGGVYSFNNGNPVHYIDDPKIGNTYAIVAP